MATLYLRPSERELLEKLPSALAGACAVEDEELTSFESTSELVVRMRLVASDAHPEVRDFVLGVLHDLQRGKEINPKALARLPHESLPVVYFGMGALGLCALIEVLFPSVRSREDLEGLAGLTKVRHLLLEANASALV
ncbi:hypothetical protein A2454_05430 [Candidatus Peribacteria bacterium RIFOXYC2_FULL_55_14]|nr:MAG: hypothetical protein A2198_03965 [Candidatus Peribacteria bacterium RIFOXYA1_FULL_56_14]OGJ73164.1 MAG: hypothetical protein A2217_03260 [Candidatus Peribacteria bacterium RIFOXYA2_FULL_55_28]OGJ75449.1 MAG: hypothetical protein A2384_00960 [Candidatus Peribacteria bacterium RIFOXYB1_FULL_54_35]OGJ76375.1 MAG: hypothetical protein A2327_00910 [Candidatus Peribacteria bacterium RIFOXYB2_FULL_54_17]OGJ79396.1 MAG: hypothetical protein A2424_02640 [Candidatus Peribacteria bacterium RIFOXYC